MQVFWGNRKKYCKQHHWIVNVYLCLSKSEQQYIHFITVQTQILKYLNRYSGLPFGYDDTNTGKKYVSLSTFPRVSEHLHPGRSFPKVQWSKIVLLSVWKAKKHTKKAMYGEIAHVNGISHWIKCGLGPQVPYECCPLLVRDGLNAENQFQYLLVFFLPYLVLSVLFIWGMTWMHTNQAKADKRQVTTHSIQRI